MSKPHPLAVVELAERHSQAAALFSLEGLGEARKRAHALLLIFLAGAGAVGSLGLAQIEKYPPIAITALSCSAYWFGLAAYITWRAATTDPVRSWATPGLLGEFPKWAQWVDEERAEAHARGDDAEQDPVLALRESAIRNCEEACSGYRDASSRTFAVVDTAYRAAAATPIVAGLAWAACLVA